MLHELLFALYGCPCDIFILDEKRCLVVDTSLPFITGAEQAIINETLALGTKYMKIRDFISSHDHVSFGKYMMALCESLETSVGAYERCLERLEAELLEDRQLGVGYLCHAVRGELPLLRALELLCDEVARNRTRGCRLLDTVRRHVQAAVGERVVRQLQLVENSCWRALYAQLASWLVYGLLVDPADELFIQPCRSSSSTLPAAAAAAPGATTGADSEPDGVDVETKMTRLAALRDSYSGRQMAFELRPSMLPACLPQSLCDDILFVGNTIHLCRQPQSATDACVAPLGHDSAPRHACPALSILEQHADQLLGQLQLLADQLPVRLHQLQLLVARAKRLVSHHLWRCVVVDARLLVHLLIVKRFLLLGDGALFDELMVECDRLLTSSLPALSSAASLRSRGSAASLETDLNAALLVVCGRLGVDDDAVLDNVSLTVAPPGGDAADKPVSLSQLTQPPPPSSSTTTAAAAAGGGGQGECSDGWQRLRVEYAVPWPLHLVFSSDVFAKYNRLFAVLLLVKRTQRQLSTCWQQVVRQCRSDRGATKPENRQRTVYLYTAMFIVNSVQHYMMLDTVESQFAQLLTDSGIQPAPEAAANTPSTTAAAAAANTSSTTAAAAAANTSSTTAAATAANTSSTSTAAAAAVATTTAAGATTTTGSATAAAAAGVFDGSTAAAAAAGTADSGDCHDFLRLQLAHETFLSRVAEQCFLHAPHVLQYLRQLLADCRQLARAVAEHSPTTTAAAAAETTQLYQQLHGKAQVLFRVLSCKSDHTTGGHLTRLLHRMDLNHHFSSCIQS